MVAFRYHGDYCDCIGYAILHLVILNTLFSCSMNLIVNHVIQFQSAVAKAGNAAYPLHTLPVAHQNWLT